MTTEPSREFLGGEQAVLSDTRDFALVVLIDHQGVCDARAQGISHKQAAEWLQHIVNLWSQRDD
jgi:hypothetical protein